MAAILFSYVNPTAAGDTPAAGYLTLSLLNRETAAGVIRTTLYAEGIQTPTVYASVQKISDARDSLDGRSDDDQGIGTAAVANLVPTDANSIAFGRTPDQVLNVVYLNSERVRSGGFFPAGVNGSINTSGDFDYDGD